MAIYAQFDEDGPCIQLATNTGWSEFGDWVETLKNSPATLKFWESGECTDIPAMRSEMEEVLKAFPPDNPDVASVAHQVIHAIDSAEGAEFVLVTAGVTTGPDTA